VGGLTRRRHRRRRPGPWTTPASRRASSIGRRGAADGASRRRGRRPRGTRKPLPTPPHRGTVPANSATVHKLTSENRLHSNDMMKIFLNNALYLRHQVWKRLEYRNFNISMFSFMLEHPFSIVSLTFTWFGIKKYGFTWF